jgi:PAS domain S-box-containing protein
MSEGNPKANKIRQRAENILKKKSLERIFPDSEADLLKSSHELQVHQIELELINEELTQAKEQAEVTSEKFAELYYAPMGYFTLSKKNEIIDVNPTGAHMLGLDRQDLINRFFSLFVSDESKSVFDRFINEVLSSKTIQTCDLILNAKDRPVVYVYMNGLIKANNSQCQLIAIDITERKKTEKELQRLLSELNSTQTKLRVALESGNIGIWEWDLETGELILDERSEALFGRNAGTFGTTIAAFKNLIREEDISYLEVAFNKAIEKDLALEVIVRTKTKNPDSNYISLKAHIRRDRNGRPKRFTGVCFDVTGLKEIEQMILKLNEELMRSNKDLENFAYVATHDLQEPLRMVSSFMQLLAMKYENKLDEDAKDYIGFAIDGAKRMHELLNGLLTYSRLSSRGKEFSRVDMNSIKDSVIDNLKLIIKERMAEIVSDELPVVFADETQMVQLLQNLISNSIKFSQCSPKIFISSGIEDQHYVFSVRDEGIGIESQYFERIFQIFQRLSARGEYDGIGIGLAICKRIVERHKGKIWVESRPGKGSVFSFTIPEFHPQNPHFSSEPVVNLA